MELTLERDRFTSKSTTSILNVDGIFECYVLEDVCRETEPGTWTTALKISKETAIPYGRFEITITFSDRFQRRLPLLMNVPDYSGIRIHPGNEAKNTEGCLLPGSSRSPDFVSQSQIAFDKLFAKLDLALQTQKAFIAITKAIPILKR